MNREILHIALPAIVTNITIPLLGLVDTAIAGHLSGAGGAVYISAVAVGAMMFNLIYWNFGFLRMGTSGLTAQAYGRADKAAATLVLQHASVLALLIGLGIIALQWSLQRITLIAIGAEPGVEALALTYFYIAVWGAPPTLVMMAIKGWMIGMQDSKHPMHISIGVNVVNILLSLTAVTVLGLGFKGIAIGTVVAQWLGLGYSLWILRRKYGEHLSDVSLRQALHFRGARGFFRVNVHIFVRSTLMMVQALFFTSASARAGNMTLAVNTLILHMGILFSYFMDGLAFAGEAITGKYFGQGNRKAEHRCVRHLFGWGMAFAAVCTLIYAIFPEEIFSLLTSDRSVVHTALRYRWWCAVIPVAGMAAFVWDGVFIGLTRTRHMTTAVGIALGVFILCYVTGVEQWGNHALWAAYVGFLATRSIVQSVQYAQLRQSESVAK